MGFKDERNKYNAKFGNDAAWSVNQQEKRYDDEFGREAGPRGPRRKALKKDKDGYYYRDPGGRTEFGQENFPAFEEKENQENQENQEKQEEGKQNLECDEEKCPHCH
jgi:hypothetical protein